MPEPLSSEPWVTRYGLRLLWITGGLIAIAALFSIAQRMTTVHHLSQALATATAENATVAATHAALQTQIVLATQGANLDEHVRDATGMIRPGDEVLAPVPVGTLPSRATPPSPSPELQPQQPWRVWWRLFFGPLP